MWEYVYYIWLGSSDNEALWSNASNEIPWPLGQGISFCLCSCGSMYFVVGIYDTEVIRWSVKEVNSLFYG